MEGRPIYNHQKVKVQKVRAPFLTGEGDLQQSDLLSCSTRVFVLHTLSSCCYSTRGWWMCTKLGYKIQLGNSHLKCKERKPYLPRASGISVQNTHPANDRRRRGIKPRLRQTASLSDLAASAGVRHQSEDSLRCSCAFPKQQPKAVYVSRLSGSRCLGLIPLLLRSFAGCVFCTEIPLALGR